jgi:hypothetical protein
MRLQFAPGFVLIVLLSSSLQAQNRKTDTTATQVPQSQRAMGSSKEVQRKNILSCQVVLFLR